MLTSSLKKMMAHYPVPHINPYWQYLINAPAVVYKWL